MLLLEYSIIGIASGGIYALVALGFVLIFKATGVFNFAMGEMMMFGAYFFFTATELAGLHWGFGLPIALLGAFAMGGLIERVVLRPMLGQPMIALVMVTVGLGSVLKGLAALIWSPDIQKLLEVLPRNPVFLGDILVPGKTFWGFVLAIGVIATLLIYLRYSRAGIAMRATASDQINAYSMGIDVPRVFGAVWGAAAVTGTICGIILASINGLEPHLGDIALNVLAVVILGGLDSLGGVIVAGLAIGWLQSVTGAYFGGQWRDVVPFAAVLLVLIVRPHGLFGIKAIERI